MGKNEACGFAAGAGAGVGHVVAKKWERGCCDDDESDRTELTRDHFAGMRSVGVQRKKRMPRQKRSSLNLNLNLLLLPFPSLLVPHVPSPPVIDRTRLRFLFQKELQTSDVGSLKRMIVPKKAAEDYLPTLTEKEGFFMRMDDMDGLHVWSFKFSSAQLIPCLLLQGSHIEGSHIEGWVFSFRFGLTSEGFGVDDDTTNSELRSSAVHLRPRFGRKVVVLPEIRFDLICLAELFWLRSVSDLFLI